MELTKKQIEVIHALEYFIPERYDGSVPRFGENNLYKERDDGVTAEEAYFLKTNKGQESEYIKDVKRYNKLLSGHWRLSLHVSMWEEGFTEGTLFLEDFESEPDYIRKLAADAKNRSDTKIINFFKGRKLGA